MSKRFKHRNKAVAAGLALTAALAGGVGVAAAGPPTAPKNKASGAQSEGTEQQEPSLNASMAAQAPGEAEKQEAERLAAEAKISQSQAEAAALKAVPGTVTASELGDENGSLVWEVHVRKAGGSVVEVKVDAGNGKVLAQEAGHDEGDKGTSGSKDGEQKEAGEVRTG